MDADNLHHAYILEGDADAIRAELLEFLEKKVKIDVVGNPDFWHERHDTFTIDAARALREAQSNKALSDSKKIFIVEIRGITVEAQNALLKAFEEPTADTHFFLILPSVEIVLPTLRSRVQIVSTRNSKDTSQKQKKAQDFLNLSVADRLRLISEISENKDKTQAFEIVDGLIYMYKDKHNAVQDFKDINSAAIIQELLQSRAYLHDRSPSLKLILEHIALMV